MMTSLTHTEAMEALVQQIELMVEHSIVEKKQKSFLELSLVEVLVKVQQVLVEALMVDIAVKIVVVVIKEILLAHTQLIKANTILF